MRFNNFSNFVIAITVSLSAGAVGFIFTAPAVQSGWYAGLAKPALNPPNWIFGPVWTTLYFLIGVSLYLVRKNGWKVVNPLFESGRKAWNPISERLWRGDLQRTNAICIFGTQYVLNILWPYLFFSLHLAGPAFFAILALWCAIVYTIINFYRISKPAAYLLLPYLLWVSFASYLNYSIWIFNQTAK